MERDRHRQRESFHSLVSNMPTKLRAGPLQSQELEARSRESNSVLPIVGSDPTPLAIACSICGCPLARSWNWAMTQSHAFWYGMQMFQLASWCQCLTPAPAASSQHQNTACVYIFFLHFLFRVIFWNLRMISSLVLTFSLLQKQNMFAGISETRQFIKEKLNLPLHIYS